MLKALFRKQFLENFSFFFRGKDGKRRSVGKILGFAALMVFAFGSVGVSMWMLCDALCAPLVDTGNTWLYFAFTGLIALALSLIGSVFTAVTKLYYCKDNDLLLSMPIPSWMILFTRVVGLYGFVLLFQALVMLPAIACYAVTVGWSAWTAVCVSLLSLLLLGLFSLSICCFLGWLLALVMAKFPVKKIFTYIFSIGTFALIMYAETKFNDLLTSFLANPDPMSKILKTWLYPLYQFGLACAGEWVSLAVVAGMFVGVFAITYFIMNKTYLSLATAKTSGKKAKYIAKGYKQKSLFSTLLTKETKRFFQNPMLVLNGLLGSVFLLVLPFLPLFSKELLLLRDIPQLKGVLSLLIAVMAGAVGAMNILSAASISLEGETLWQLRSMPVKTDFILFVKGAMHFIFTGIPMAFCAIAVSVVFKIGVVDCILLTVALLSFTALLSAGGLVVNLKLPNLHWTNEIVVVKQSFAGVLSMFLGIGVALLFVGGWFLFGKYLPAWGYLLIVTAILWLATALLSVWLRTKGKDIFETL